MNSKRMGDKIIHYFGNGQFAMTENNKGYILEGNKWVDENTYKFHRLTNRTDRLIMEEIEVEEFLNQTDINNLVDVFKLL